MRTPYVKPALTYSDQLAKLEERGLLISNREKALHLLENINYYRLSGYWYPLLKNKEKHIFKSGAKFDIAFKIYCFDRELRKLLLREIEKIEVAFRVKLSYIYSMHYDPFWFLDSTLFRSSSWHKSLISKIKEEIDRSDEEFIVAFKNKYSETYPPCWMTFEISSFGKLSQLYSCLNHGRSKRDVSSHFGLSDNIFQSWLHSIVYLRNICAHHTRLWNRELRVTPQKPRSVKYSWINAMSVSSNRMYFVLSMIKYLLNRVNPGNTLKGRFLSLVALHEKIDLSAMGFPPNWEKEPLWINAD